MNTKKRDDSMRGKAAIPAFQAPDPTPEPALELTPEPTPEPTQEPTPKPARRTRLQTFLQPDVTPDETSTATSTSPTDTPAPRVGIAEATIAISGAIDLLTVLAGFAVRVRSRGTTKLRRPSRAELADIAEPLARIASRFVPASMLAPTVADATASATAVTKYATRAPLLERTIPASGMPDNLNVEV